MMCPTFHNMYVFSPCVCVLLRFCSFMMCSTLVGEGGYSGTVFGKRDNVFTALSDNSLIDRLTDQ